MAKAQAPKKRTAKRKPAAVKARVTQPDYDVGQSGGAGWKEAQLQAAFYQFGLLDEYKDQVYVNDYTAMAYAAVWRCIVYISQTIASLGWHQFESVPGKQGKERIYDDISWLLDTQASPEMSAFDFRQTVLMDVLRTGNGFGELDKDGFGRTRWIWYIPCNRVSLKRSEGGSLYYEVDNGPGEMPTIIPPENMFHAKGPSPDGLWGYSVIALARQSIRLGLQMEKYGDTFFRRGPMPGGVLEIPGPMKDEERKAMRKSFEDAYGGSKNAGRVVVASGGIKFNPLSLPNEDAQFIESRKFEVTEVCRWFGVPPHKIYDLERATFTNIEHQSIEAVQDCHLPWCRRLETEADIKLFGRIMRGRRWTRLNLNTLLRGDSATQTANLVSQVHTGLITPDEAREHLDYNPYPKGLGKEPIVQGAMMTLESALNPPEPPQPAPQPAQTNPDQPQQGDNPPQNRAMPAQVAATFGPLLSEAYSRLLRVDSDKAHRANNKGQLTQHARDFYTAESVGRIASAIKPVVAAFLLACDRPAEDATGYAEDFAADHVRRCVCELSRGTWAAEWANGRAGEQADTHLRELWERIK